MSFGVVVFINGIAHFHDGEITTPRPFPFTLICMALQCQVKIKHVPDQARTQWRGGGEGVGRPPPPPTSNYRAPPAHRFHKYKLRLLYFRMQKLTPYSIKFLNKMSGGACPQTLLGRHCADAPPPPPSQLTTPPPWSTLGTGRTVRPSDGLYLENTR